MSSTVVVPVLWSFRLGDGLLLMPGRSTNLDNGRARAYCACSRCGGIVLIYFFSHLSFLFSFSLSLEWMDG